MEKKMESQEILSVQKSGNRGEGICYDDIWFVSLNGLNGLHLSEDARST